MVTIAIFSGCQERIWALIDNVYVEPLIIYNYLKLSFASNHEWKNNYVLSNL